MCKWKSSHAWICRSTGTRSPTNSSCIWAGRFCMLLVILSSCNISDAELRFTWRHIMAGHLQVRVTIKLLNHSHWFDGYNRKFFSYLLFYFLSYLFFFIFSIFYFRFKHRSSLLTLSYLQTHKSILVFRFPKKVSLHWFMISLTRASLHPKKKTIYPSTCDPTDSSLEDNLFTDS